jgi:hypothetical protein
MVRGWLRSRWDGEALAARSQVTGLGSSSGSGRPNARSEARRAGSRDRISSVVRAGAEVLRHIAMSTA